MELNLVILYHAYISDYVYFSLTMTRIPRFAKYACTNDMLPFCEDDLSLFNNILSICSNLLKNASH